MSSNWSECPICMELPTKEVFQCQNGHPLCDDCYEKIEICPQCRISFGTEKLRCTRLEVLLNAHSFPCPFNDLGCTEVQKRDQLPLHARHCQFRIRKQTYCKMLGFKCNFETNLLDITAALAHFRTHHQAPIFESSQCHISLRNFSEQVKGHSQNILWSPVILQLGENTLPKKTFLCVASTDKTDMFLNFGCILMEDPLLPLDKNFRVTFTVQNCSHTIFPQALPWAGKTGWLAKWPIIRMPLDLMLVSNPMKDRLDVVSFSVKVSIGAEGASGIKPVESITVPPFPKTCYFLTPKWICDVCKEPSNRDKTLFKCLQCCNYDLCESCVSTDAHSHHLFAMCKSYSHKEYMTMVGTGKSGWKPIIPPGKSGGNKGEQTNDNEGCSSTTCFYCEETIELSEYYYVCLLCPRVDLCVDCMIQDAHSQHIFGIVRSRTVTEFCNLQRTLRSSLIPWWSDTLSFK